LPVVDAALLAQLDRHVADVLINWSPKTRVAIVESGAVQELHVERTLERGLVGDVFLGEVVRVLPGVPVGVCGHRTGIHAKLTLKGSQLVYQLDVTSRELRMLKDNFFLMEGLMHKEMRH